jgi:hypothetical protein
VAAVETQTAEPIAEPLPLHRFSAERMLREEYEACDKGSRV